MSYYQRNQRWLNPLVGLVIVVAAHPLVTALQDPAASQSTQLTPAWLTSLTWAGAFLGLFAVGLGAVLTQTLSAAILRIVVPGVLLALLLVLLDVSVRTVAICTVAAWIGMGTTRKRSR